VKHLFLKFLDLLPVIGLAAFGGVTRTVAGKARGEAYSLRIAIPEVVIAVFSGLLIHWLTLDTGMSDNLRTAGIALAGYSARSVIAILNALFVNAVKKRTFFLIVTAVVIIAVCGCAVVKTDTPVADQSWYEYRYDWTALYAHSSATGNLPWWYPVYAPYDLYLMFFVPGNWH